MGTREWTLLDVDNAIAVGDWEIPAGDLPAAARGCRVSKRSLWGGLSDGVDLIRVENGRMWFDVLPTRGMGLWKARCDDLDVGWQSPVRGPVHPKFVPVGDPGGLGWLDGFDELLVRCGLVSNGAPVFDDKGKLKYPLHGRIANRPARKVTVSVDEDSGEIRVCGWVDESRFLFHSLELVSCVSTLPEQNEIRVRDEVVNLSGTSAEAQLLYHINFGKPLLDSGSRFAAPLTRVAPRDARAAEGMETWNVYGPEEPGFAEQVYFMEALPDAEGTVHALLKNVSGSRGVSLIYATRTLPCFTLWKNTGSAAEGYVTGLEPGTNYPNPRPFEGAKGRVAALAPGARTQFEVRLQVHTDAAGIAAAEADIARRAAGREPVVHDSPFPEWCAG